MNSAASTTITHGPMAGWDLNITHIEHGTDAMEDHFYLDLYQPEADRPTHSLHTFRYGYGFDVVNAALTGQDEHLTAAMDWWTTNHTTALYAIHQILITIDDATWATASEIAERLGIPADALNSDQPYGRALAAAQRSQLITWNNNRTNPMASLSPIGYDFVHPDDAPAGEHSQQQVTEALATEAEPVARPLAAMAFQPLTRVQPTAPPTTSMPTTADTPAARIAR